MTRREEVQGFLKGQFEIFQGVHVAELMKFGQYKELEAIRKNIELDLSPLEVFWEEEDEAIYRPEEIPKEFLYELICYMCCSGYDDDNFCDSYEHLQNVLRATGEVVLLQVADVMDIGNLCFCSFKQLVA